VGGVTGEGFCFFFFVLGRCCLYYFEGFFFGVAVGGFGLVGWLMCFFWVLVFVMEFWVEFWGFRWGFRLVLFFFVGGVDLGEGGWFFLVDWGGNVCFCLGWGF